MHDSQSAQGNGAADVNEHSEQDDIPLGEHGRRIRHDTIALARAVRDTTAGIERYLSNQVIERPYVTLGAAAGVGYLLGGGIRLRLTAILLGATTRLVTALAVTELRARLYAAESAPSPTTPT